MEKRELIKVMCQAVILLKDGDKVIREETTQAISCYSLEDMNDFYVKAKAEVDAMNTANNRASRRKGGSSGKSN